jgi:hypothetical protein
MTNWTITHPISGATIQVATVGYPQLVFEEVDVFTGNSSTAWVAGAMAWQPIELVADSQQPLKDFLVAQGAVVGFTMLEIGGVENDPCHYVVGGLTTAGAYLSKDGTHIHSQQITRVMNLK